MSDRNQKELPTQPAPWNPKEVDSPFSEPKRPEIDLPDNKKLLEKLRKVDPNKSKKYCQRSGE